MLPVVPSAHPRDRFITVYGRKPVLEALERGDVTVGKVLVARGSKGDIIARIEAAARERGATLELVTREAVTKLSRNRRQDQGVAADVLAPRMDDLASALAAGQIHEPLLALDGVTTPANVGMILRTATAAGLGVVLPREGSPEVGPLVVKASAGVAFGARILRCPALAPALEQLAAHGFRIVGLDGAAEQSLWDVRLGARDVLVLGGEAHGLSPATLARLDTRVRIPLEPAVESLNVAAAAAVAAFELRRQRG